MKNKDILYLLEYNKRMERNFPEKNAYWHLQKLKAEMQRVGNCSNDIHDVVHVADDKEYRKFTATDSLYAYVIACDCLISKEGVKLYQKKLKLFYDLGGSDGEQSIANTLKSCLELKWKHHKRKKA